MQQQLPDETWRARWRLFNFLGTLTLVLALALAVQAWLYLGRVYWTGPDESRLTRQAWLWNSPPSIPQTTASIKHENKSDRSDPTNPSDSSNPSAPSYFRASPLPLLLTALTLRHPRADLFTSPRLLAAGFAFLAALALLLLAQELFASRTVTATAGVLAALDARRAFLSIVPLPEIQFLAWLFWGLFCALRGLRSGGAGWLGAAAACFLLAGLAHPAGWVFVAIYLLLLAGRVVARLPLPWPTLLANATALVVFTLLWMIFFPRLVGRTPAFLVRLAAFSGLHTWTDLLRRLEHSVPWIFVLDNLRQLNLLGLLGLGLWLRRQGSSRLWAFIPALTLVVVGLLNVFGLSAFTPPAAGPWRAATPWSLALVPFTAAAIVSFAPRTSWLGWRLGPWRPLLPITLFFIIAALFARDTVAQKHLFAANADVLRTGAALRSALADARLAGNPPPRILIETTTDSAHLNIEVLARDFAPFAAVSEFTGGDPIPPFRSADLPPFFARLRAERVRLLVFRTSIHKRIVFTYPNTRVLGEFGDWTIFAFR